MTNSICKNHCPLNNTNDKNPSYCHSIYVMNCNTYKTFKIKQDIIVILIKHSKLNKIFVQLVNYIIFVIILVIPL